MSGFYLKGDSLPVMLRETPAQAIERSEEPREKPGGEISLSPVENFSAASTSAVSGANPAKAASPPVLAVPDVPAVPYEEKPAPAPTAGQPQKSFKAAGSVRSSVKRSSVKARPQSRPAWRVQVGAFSTKAAADDVARRISKDGHSVAVVSGNRVHRVLVSAASGSEASALAARMDRSGFPGAFVISPR
jgi:rare lipoprotein A